MSTNEERDDRGIRCPACGSSWVPVSHTERLGKSIIRRRRRCEHCGTRFVTTERPAKPADDRA